MGGPVRFCRQCGRELRPGARFCAYCGESTSLSGQPAAQAGGALPRRESGAGAPFPPRDQPRTAWSRRPLIAGVVVLVLAGLAAATLLIVHPFGHHAGPRSASTLAPTSAPAPTPTPTPTPGPTPGPTSASPSLSRQQAAGNLATLLAQSVSDRNSIRKAYNDALRCGPGLRQDAQTFQNGASSREQLLSQLADMPSRSALPGQVLGDLTSAWQASVRADKDYAKWAQDLVSAGCAGGNQSDPHFVAASTPNLQATADKKAFVRQWNPLAAQYGLTRYKQDEL
jgi:zinc-ribbon domain